MEELKPNVGKNDIIVVDGVSYQRLPIRTHLITDKDNILDVAEKYGSPVLTEPDDILFISEKCVACTQKRAIPLEDIKPRKLATWLSKHVTKTPHGIGLGMPETMEMALREVGSLRILFAAAIGDDKENIRRIYKDGFLDITKLEELPKNMAQLVKQHLK